VAGDGGAVHHDPVQALAWVRAAVERETSLSRLLIIHQDAFAGHDGAGRLTTWLDDVTSLRAPLLPVLLHGDLPAMQLVEFFRAGLFDALAVPVARADWVNMLIRAEKQIERRHRGRLLLASSGRTRETLRQLQRELGDPEESPAELLQGARQPADGQPAIERSDGRVVAALPLRSRVERGQQLGRGAARDPAQPDRFCRRRRRRAGAARCSRVAPTRRGRPGNGTRARGTRCSSICRTRSTRRSPRASWRPGIFRVEPGRSPGDAAGQRLIALPLEHQDVRLGYLLLLFVSPETREAVSRRYLPFLQAVRLVLAEEIAGAQHSDRVREVGAFNARVLQTVSSAIWGDR
jgi:hypothetical protein